MAALIAPHKRQAGVALAPPPRAAQKPVRHADHGRRPIPVLALLGVLDDVVQNAPLVVKLKLEQAREFLLWSLGPRHDAGDFLHHVADLPVLLPVRLATCLPPHNQLLVAHVARCRAPAILHHALRQYPELHVAHHGNLAPCDRRRPQCCDVRKPPAHRRQMWVGRGKQVQANVRGEDVLGER